MKEKLENIAEKITKNIGSVYSVIIHTIIFLIFFILIILGFDAEKIMLILTTIVSLEAIYLSLFIQMSVNRNTQSIAHIEKDVTEVHDDIEDIQGDIEEIQEDIEDVQEDIEEIQEDIEDVQEDVEGINKDKK